MPDNISIPQWVFNIYNDEQGVRRSLGAGMTARVFAGKHAMLSVVRVEPHAAGTVHSHPEEQWGVLLEGECHRIQGDEVIPVKAGDFWYTPGGVPHSIRTGAVGALLLDIFSPPRPEYTCAGGNA
jgi:quercetin dioxygenase-like cupin family protein